MNIDADIIDLVRKKIGSNTGKTAGDEKYLPASGKVLDESDYAYQIQAVLDGWLTSGRFNDLFEDAIKQLLGVKYVLTVNSGSSANLIAFSSLLSKKLGDKKICPGSEIITVATSFPTTVNPIIQNRCIPVFCDAELGHYNINMNQLSDALTEKTKGVMLAHTLGNPFEVQKVQDFCDQHGLFLIEDCCDALGSTYQDQIVGTFGHFSTFSFYPAHHITTGEGGAVATNDPKLYNVARSLRDWGRDCWCPAGHDDSCRKRFGWQLGNLPAGYDHKYIYSEIGYNLKMTDVQAACGLAQINKIDQFGLKRKANFMVMLKELQSLQDKLILPTSLQKSQPSWFGFPICIRQDVNKKRSDLQAYLESHGIGSRLIFAGNITKQPCLENADYRIVGDLTNSDLIMNNALWLGIHQQLNESDVLRISQCVKGFFST